MRPFEEAWQQRCPQMDYDVWMKMTEGPERALVELIFDNGTKMEAYFYDGALGSYIHGYDLSRVVDTKIIKGL